MKLIKATAIGCVMAMNIYAQNNVDRVLMEVEANNKSIHANNKYWDAKRIEFRTGLTPYDPQVEYDYMFGSPAEAGNQRDFSITQRLDFPTVYKRRRNLSRTQIEQSELHQRVHRQKVLLEAKLAAIEIIYLNRRGAELKRRQASTQRLSEDYQKKLDQGDATILDVNKAKIQLLNIGNDLELNHNQIQIATTKLIELNGGKALAVTDTIYPVVTAVPDFETLDSIIEANDPILKVHEQDKKIMESEIAVQKSLNLPKIETGYHSQGILGQSYKGAHAGITIPLWENKNKLRAAQSNLDYAVAKADAHIIEHRLGNKGYYDLLAVRSKQMREYTDVLSSLNNSILLDKALRLGQITVIQFFQEEAFYFSAYDKYLQMEAEYHKAIARLYSFQL
jgi:outer membrane protein, heavy metal efflux system